LVGNEGNIINNRLWVNQVWSYVGYYYYYYYKKRASEFEGLLGLSANALFFIKNNNN